MKIKILLIEDEAMSPNLSHRIYNPLPNDERLKHLRLSDFFEFSPSQDDGLTPILIKSREFFINYRGEIDADLVFIDYVLGTGTAVTGINIAKDYRNSCPFPVSGVSMTSKYNDDKGVDPDMKIMIDDMSADPDFDLIANTEMNKKSDILGLTKRAVSKFRDVLLRKIRENPDIFKLNYQSFVDIEEIVNVSNKNLSLNDKFDALKERSLVLSYGSGLRQYSIVGLFVDQLQSIEIFIKEVKVFLEKIANLSDFDGRIISIDYLKRLIAFNERSDAFEVKLARENIADTTAKLKDYADDKSEVRKILLKKYDVSSYGKLYNTITIESIAEEAKSYLKANSGINNIADQKFLIEIDQFLNNLCHFKCVPIPKSPYGKLEGLDYPVLDFLSVLNSSRYSDCVKNQSIAFLLGSYFADCHSDCFINGNQKSTSLDDFYRFICPVPELPMWWPPNNGNYKIGSDSSDSRFKPLQFHYEKNYIKCPLEMKGELAYCLIDGYLYYLNCLHPDSDDRKKILKDNLRIFSMNLSTIIALDSFY